MPQVNIVAIFYPAPGKVERVRELLVNQCKQVHKAEDYALRFLLTEQIQTETPEFCLFETYTSEEAASQHVLEPHFKQMFAKLEKEGLMERKPHVARTVTTAGFDLDRVLL